MKWIQVIVFTLLTGMISFSNLYANSSVQELRETTFVVG